jgi:hypothetical protein
MSRPHWSLLRAEPMPDVLAWDLLAAPWRVKLRAAWRIIRARRAEDRSWA